MHFQNPWWSAFYKIWAKENSKYSFIWSLTALRYEVWLLFFQNANSGGQRNKLQGEGTEVAVPLWLQSGVRSTSLRYITLLILLHKLLAVPTCWVTFNSWANFDLLFFYFFFLALVFILWPVQEAHSSSWECLSLADACHMLTYPDIYFFLISQIYSTSQSPYGYCFFMYSSGSLSFAFQRFVTETILSGTSLCAWFI